MGSSECMLLYWELDGLIFDRDVDVFCLWLEDCFGFILFEIEELLCIVLLRCLVVWLGVEKVFLKGGCMILFFVNNVESLYY